MNKLKKKSMMGLIISLIFMIQPLATTSLVSGVSPTDPGLQGMWTLSNKADLQGAVVNSKTAGSSVFCGDVSSTENFNWEFIYFGKYTNDYYIINQYNMLLMGISGASSADGADVVTNPLARNTAGDWAIKDEFLFEFEEVGDYYEIKSCLSGLYLTQDANGNIVQRVKTGAMNQQWELTAKVIRNSVYDKLIWADEFDYTGLPNSSKWSFEQIWVNNELQYYTVDDTDNCYVENGQLRITAIKEQAINNQQYTSARINSKGKFEFKYGKVEARILLPEGRGTWPAFWMMPGTFNDQTNPWPGCGEIDIMEYVGFEPTRIHGNSHTQLYNGMNGNNYGASVDVSEPFTNWHNYSIIWSEERISWLVDGWEYFVYDNAGLGKDQYPFTDPFFIIINLAIGGSWGGAMGVDNSIFPVSYYVDWVRVYQESEKEDNTPPAQVTGLTTSLVSGSQIGLSWDANLEPDIDYYNIYRNGDKITETASNLFNDTALLSNTVFNYEVSAVDNCSNEGQKSVPLTVNTLEDSDDDVAPSQVAGVITTVISSSEIMLYWNPNLEADFDQYYFYRNGTKIAETSSSTYRDTGLTANTDYSYEVSAVDTNGNEGNKSNTVTVTTENDGAPNDDTDSNSFNISGYTYGIFFLSVLGAITFSILRRKS